MAKCEQVATAEETGLIAQAQAEVVGGANIKTGKVAIGINKTSVNHGTICAEDIVVSKLGGNKAEIIMTSAVRPRKNKLYLFVLDVKRSIQRICLNQERSLNRKFSELNKYEGE